MNRAPLSVFGQTFSNLGQGAFWSGWRFGKQLQNMAVKTIGESAGSRSNELLFCEGTEKPTTSSQTVRYSEVRDDGNHCG